MIPRAAADIRCATVDVKMLLDQYQQTQKDSKSLLDRRKKYMQKQIDLHQRRKKLVMPIKALIAKIRAETKPSQKKDSLIRKYEELSGEYRSLDKDIEDLESGHVKTIKREVHIAMQRSLEEIRLSIHQYARDHGYHWIIDTSGSSNSRISPLIYAKNAPDVTKEILAIINADSPDKQNKKSD